MSSATNTNNGNVNNTNNKQHLNPHQRLHLELQFLQQQK